MLKEQKLIYRIKSQNKGITMTATMIFDVEDDHE
jgi:hypothetical protein